MEWCGYNWKCEMEGGRIIHPEYPWYWCSLDTIKRNEDDTLELSMRENPRDVKHWDGKIYHPTYEVATMRSIEDFSYGTFSAEIKVPKGKRLSASFWTTGSGNWPPEIDIEEGWTEEKPSWFRWMIAQFPYFKPSWRTTTNIHYNNELMKHDSIGSRNIPWFKQCKNPSDNFIKYECEWLPNKITFKANGRIIRTITGHVCKNLTNNLEHPERGFRMNVVFNVWVENPDIRKPEIIQPMFIRNFKYTKYTEL